MPRHRGAKASPRHKLVSASKHLSSSYPVGPTGALPTQLSDWGNFTLEDCVTAEEMFAKAVYSVMASNGQSELFIPSVTATNWAAQYGYLDGAVITDVMETMANVGIQVGGITYTDGPYQSVDWTNNDTLCSAISQGPVKIGVAADQLESVVGSTNGWIATGFRQDENEDHCVCLVNYGTMSALAVYMGVSLPAGVNGTGPGYILGTWSTFGIIDQASMLAITYEAWLRTPTTPQETLVTPPVTPTPVTPTPVTPTPVTPTPVPPVTPTPAPGTLAGVPLDATYVSPATLTYHAGPGMEVVEPVGVVSLEFIIHPNNKQLEISTSKTWTKV